MFNACDHFNTSNAFRYWPYRRKGWQANIDDFYFTSALTNAHSAFNELHSVENHISYSQFTTQASIEIWDKAQSL